MVFERFSEEARKAMSRAQKEAQRFGGESIDTEHILLGIIKEGGGGAAQVLKRLHVDLECIGLEIEKRIPRSAYGTITLGFLSFAPRAKRAIELADETAGELGHEVIGTEHLLLGLLKEGEGIAAQVLMHLGLNLDGLRSTVLKVHEQGIMSLLAELNEPEFIEILEHMEMVTDTQLQEALKRSLDTGDSITDILIELGYVSREQMLMAIATFQGMKGGDAISMPISDTDPIPIPVAWAYHVVPIKALGNIMTVALATSPDVAVGILDDLRKTMGRHVAASLAPQDAVLMALKRRYPIPVALSPPPARRGTRLEIVPGLGLPAGADLLFFVGIKDSFRVWCRVEGIFYEIESPSHSYGLKIIEDLKSRVSLGDPGLHRLNLQITVFPTPSGESAIVRIEPDAYATSPRL